MRYSGGGTSSASWVRTIKTLGVYAGRAGGGVAAVLLTVDADGSYVEVMRRAAAAVDLKGGWNFRPPGGKRGYALADSRWSYKSRHSGTKGVGNFQRRKRVSDLPPPPTKHAEIRMRNVVLSFTMEDVAAALAAAGGCGTGEVKTGVLRFSLSSCGSLGARLQFERQDK